MSIPPQGDGYADVTECDREPIHIPGMIQPIGALLACSERDWTVSHVSANAFMLADVPSSVLGKTLTDVLGQDVSHDLKNALSSSAQPGLPGRVSDKTLADGKRYHFAIHSHEGRVIIDIEPVVHESDAASPLFLARNMLIRMQQAETIDDACAVAVRQLRPLIDFDRALVYKFLADGSGSVIAEDRVDEVESFMGHHYPASDIPQQARQLYVKNWLRLIASVEDTPVPVLAVKGDGAPLDMTYSALRSVSPIHIEYLKNMGVVSSLSISIVVGGSLWGLIACHNYSRRVVPIDSRMAAEFFGQAFSLQLQTLARADVSEQLRNARVEIDRIVSEIPPGAPLWVGLGRRLSEVRAILACDGVALWCEGRLTTVGETPPDAEIPLMADAIAASGISGLFETNRISSIYPPAAAYAAKAAGVMAVPLSRSPGEYLMFFRREFVQTIPWAGNPQKVLVGDRGALPLSPRRSFAVWREEVRCQSRDWEPHDRLTGEALRMALLEIVLKYSELVAEERALSDRRQRLQAAEFNHRVKNALALVGALVSQSQGKGVDVSAFISDLQGRIRSLALAHDLAAKPDALELGELLRIELQPYAEANIQIAGPTVWLTEGTASILALVVHELVTNACKHGALSVGSGQVDAKWEFDASGGCSIEWRERGGPEVSEPAEQGFGMVLITRQVPFELGGRAAVRHERSGLEVDLWLPATSLRREAAPAPPTDSSESELPPPSPLNKMSILVVEDSLVVALELDRRLRRLGAGHVSVSGTLDQASILARSLKLDFAILDIDLKGVKSFPIAEVLISRGIPFVFSTGYGATFGKPSDLQRVPQLAKPYSDTELLFALERARILRRNES